MCIYCILICSLISILVGTILSKKCTNKWISSAVIAIFLVFQTHFATWYKKNLKESLFDQVYINKNKVNGIEFEDKEVKQKIYDRYVEAFEKGVYNYIKEDIDSATQEMIPRKYFSGGLDDYFSEDGRNRFTEATGNVPAALVAKVGRPHVTAKVKGEALGGAEEASSPISKTHVVEDGAETLQTVASEYGMPEELILKLNPGRDISDSLRSGDEIKIDPMSLKKQHNAFQVAINGSGEIGLGFILRIIREQDTPAITTRQEQLPFGLFQRRLAHYPVQVGEPVAWGKDEGYDYGTHGDIPLLKKKLLRVEAEAMIEERIKEVTEESSSPIGGIDFNPNNINLSEQGDKMQINFSATDLQNLNPESINGILPVIINISPLPSFLPLLGLEPRKKENYVEVSSLN